MEPEPFHGDSFILLPLRFLALSGELASWPSQVLSVFVALAVHAGPDGFAYPGEGRLATLAGVSKSTVGPCIERLTRHGLINPQRKGYREGYVVELGVGKNAFAFRQQIVFNGLWGYCTPAARILYLVLLAASRPGDDRYWSAYTNDEWQEAVSESEGDEGYRHVLLKHASPSKLQLLCAIADRTFRAAMSLLVNYNMVKPADDQDVWLIPNAPGKWIPDLVRALDRPKNEGSAGAKRSLSARRKRTRTAQPIVVEGNPLASEREFPEAVTLSHPKARSTSGMNQNHNRHKTA